MTVTASPRFGLNQWGAGTDPFTRAQRNSDNAQVEALGALDAQGTLAIRPAAGVRGRWYWTTDTLDQYRDDGTTWRLAYPATGTPSALTPGGVNTAGTSKQHAAADHLHGLPAWASTAPAALTIGGAGAVGGGTAFARNDHGHTMPAAGSPVDVYPGRASAVGVAATLAASDHGHAAYPWASTASGSLTVGGAGSAGVANTYARGDHGHPMPAAGTPVDTYPGRTASAGVATTLAVSDHGHANYPWATTAADLAAVLGTASSAGTANTYSRGDHAHKVPDAVPRGTLGVASVWSNINGGATGAEAGGVGVTGISIVSGRRYSIAIKTGLLRSDSTSDSSQMRVRIDDGATGAVLNTELVSTPAGFAAGRYDPTFEFLGAAATNVAPGNGGLPTVAAGTRAFYLTFTKGSGNANAAYMILGPTTQMYVNDLGV